jgi:hypothetical protein
MLLISFVNAIAPPLCPLFSGKAIEAMPFLTTVAVKVDSFEWCAAL